MRQTDPKYVRLYEYIDSLPMNAVFSYKDLEEAVQMRVEAKPILPLVRLGMLIRVEKISQLKFYQKTEKWDKAKAIEVNYERLKAKWQKYKPLSR